jgi:hypothetical protein
MGVRIETIGPEVSRLRFAMEHPTPVETIVLAIVHPAGARVPLPNPPPSGEGVRFTSPA